MSLFKTVIDSQQMLKGNKRIRIADGRPVVSRIVREYEQNDHAEDSDDDKKFRSAVSLPCAKNSEAGGDTPYNRPMSAAAGSQAQLLIPLVLAGLH